MFPFIQPRYLALACCALTWLPQAARAAEPLYTTTSTQTGSPGTSWASSVIWRLNGTGSAMAAAPGNTYEALSNGTGLGSGNATTLLRPPYSAGTPNIAVFPGDSLILDTNTQIRLKALSTSGTSAQGLNYEVPTNSFPGANGLTGLVLKGGCLNVGDTGDAATILGTVQAFPGTLSYIDPGNTLSGDGSERGLILAAQLSGSGTVALLDGNVAVPQLVTGASNTFSGGWIVMAGWLQGAGDGTEDGYNSLGTNTACTFVVDPNWGPPPIFDASAVLNNGPAVLDMGSAVLANCGGSLILTNGGQLYLHGHVVFGAVTIEGNVLRPGTYSYDTLAGLYPSNFQPSGFPTGSGTLTVQPYGKPPALAPQITSQPAPQMLYAGETAPFTAAASGLPPITYQWQRAGTNLVDGGNILGATNTTLTVAHITAADAATYTLVATTPGGSATTVPVSLTVLALTEPCAAATVGAGPVAFYEFNDTGDPATNAYAFDSVGGFVGTYGIGVQNGNPACNIPGPASADGFPGFSAGNKAAAFANGTGTSQVTLPALNLGANATNVTITAWINPVGPQVADEGIVFCRAGTTCAGLCYTGDTDTNGNYTLGYNWNNDVVTYDWNSLLVAPQNQWSFVALVVTPANATIHLMNTRGLASSTFVHDHVAQAFDGATLIGDDSADGGDGARVFNGSIDDVAIFDSALSKSQLLAIYSAASGVSQFPPCIATQPASLGLYPAMTAQFTVPSGGSDPLYYQWQAGVSKSGAFTNLTDGGRITGSATAQLTIVNLAASDTADFRLIITNNYGALTSSVATLTLLATLPPQAITLSVQEAIGSDWDTTMEWSDGNPASISAYEFPGSTYEVLAGARLRTPLANPNAIFPGQVLTIDGDGVFVNSPAATDPVGEIRCKQPSSGSSVTFSNLVMNGGQLDLGNDGLVIVIGSINIVSNTPIYIDSGGDADRQMRIDARLTGAGSVEWSSFDTTLVGELIINGSSNQFSGTWQIDQGLLLGAAPNSLGTNSITVGANGVLWTTYNLSSPNGSLFLAGRMLLSQDDVFANVVVDGAALAPAIYPFAKLNSLYPAHFPATWTGVGGATNVYTAAGSINVGNLKPPSQVSLSARMLGPNVQLTWPQGTLLEAGQLTGPWTTNTAISPYTFTPTAPQKFYRLIIQ